MQGPFLTYPIFIRVQKCSTYEASNAGVTHKAELVGYSHPVVISNLDSAPAAVVQEPLAQPQPA